MTQLLATNSHTRSLGRNQAKMRAMTEGRHPSVWREYLEALLVAGLFLGFTNTFVLKTFYIPSGSMEDTLLVGDHLIVNRYIFGSTGRDSGGLLPERDVRRGDIVIFRSVEDPQTDLQINTQGPLTVLEACRRFNPGAKVLYASTRTIYGPAKSRRHGGRRGGPHRGATRC